jgi:predicted enzyme related to lactoylglutathione lyase
MTETTGYPQGTFCWVDLATTDPEAAKAFYGDLFGWSAEDVPTDMGEPYTMLSYQGREAAALYRLSPEQGSHPFWNSFVSVEDVDAMAARAEALGGGVLVPPMEVMEHGRMAVIQDPSGAALCLWQPRAYPGAAVDNQVGARSWCELLTRDTVRAAQFFGELLGWTTRTSPDLMEGRYILFERAGKPVAGMLEIAPQWGPVPPSWVVYFGVGDCDGVVARTRELGGAVVVEPMAIEDVGRFAYLADPQGAQFAVIQFAHPTP